MSPSEQAHRRYSTLGIKIMCKSGGAYMVANTSAKCMCMKDMHIPHVKSIKEWAFICLSSHLLLHKQLLLMQSPTVQQQLVLFSESHLSPWMQFIQQTQLLSFPLPQLQLLLQTTCTGKKEKKSLRKIYFIKVSWSKKIFISVSIARMSPHCPSCHARFKEKEQTIPELV